MLPLDTIYNEDCLQGMRRMGDGTVDCRSLRPAVPAGEPRRRLLVEERGRDGTRRRQREQARPTGQRRTRRKTLATEGTQETRGKRLKELSD